MLFIEYRIHPSVGIARMGDSATTFFVGAERPVDQFVPTLRRIPGVVDARPDRDWLHDPDGKLAKQAARFRIFAYLYHDYVFWRDDHPHDVWEVTTADYDIAWTVEVANLKSFTGPQNNRWKDGNEPGSGIHELPNRPPAQSLSTTAPDSFTGPKPFKVVADRLALGSAVLEDVGADHGTLLVIGSSGASRLIPGSLPGATTFDLFTARWEDDAADGRVTATVTPRATSTKKGADQGPKPARAATVVVAIPDYGWDIEEPGSLYDLALNHATYRSNKDRYCCGKRQFFATGVTVEKHLMPVLKSYVQLPYVSALAQVGHDRTLAEVLATPKDTVDRMRAPTPTTTEPEYIVGANTVTDFPPAPANMPLQNSYSLPRLQHGWLARWASTAGLPSGTPFPPAKVEQRHRPELMDMAAMRSMIGGSFLPGLEVGRDAGRWKNWAADWGAYEGHVDVRVTAEPGLLTRGLSVPWQVDFRACVGNWWPASRPERTTSVPNNPATSADEREFKEWMAHPGGAITDDDELLAHWAELGFLRKTGGPDYTLGDQYLDDRDNATRP